MNYVAGCEAQYLRTLVQEGELCQFDLMCADVESANPLTEEAIILGLGSYFPPINLILMQKRAMRRGMRTITSWNGSCCLFITST